MFGRVGIREVFLRGFFFRFAFLCLFYSYTLGGEVEAVIRSLAFCWRGSYRFGDVGFGREKLVLWDFWFARDMYFHGFAFEWIRLFIFQLLTVFSGIFLPVKGWTKTSYLLIPLTFSILSVLVGMIQIN